MRASASKTFVRIVHSFEVLFLIQRIAFPENVILTAHPSKSGGDWWYGTPVRERKSGFFPQTYVERVQTGTNAPDI
jgi:hypothetical protein